MNRIKWGKFPSSGLSPEKKEGHYYKGNLFVFEMGRSVKFILAIKDAICNKKMGVNFFPEKRPCHYPRVGEGPREVW